MLKKTQTYYMSGSVLRSESIKMNKEYAPNFIVNFILANFLLSFWSTLLLVIFMVCFLTSWKDSQS